MRNGNIGHSKGILSVKLERTPLAYLIQVKNARGSHHQAVRAKRATVDQDQGERRPWHVPL